VVEIQAAARVKAESFEVAAAVIAVMNLAAISVSSLQMTSNQWPGYRGAHMCDCV